MSSAFDRAQEAYDNRSEPEGDGRYEYIEGLAHQAIDHDYRELIVDGINHCPLCEFDSVIKKFDFNKNPACYYVGYDYVLGELMKIFLNSKADIFKDVAAAVIRFGCEKDLVEINKPMQHLRFLIDEIKGDEDIEVFGGDLLIYTACKYIKYDNNIWYVLNEFFHGVFDETE